MIDWKLKPAKDLGKSPKDRWNSIEREGGLTETAITLLWRSLVAYYLRIFHGFTCEGQNNIPKQLPYIIVANHSSHLDALCMIWALPKAHLGNIYAIAAEDTFFTSLSKSWFSAFALNALPLSRTGRRKGVEAMEVMRNRLQEQEIGFILFPEGTRTRTGEMAHFRSGLGMLVAGTPVPVVPAYIEGAHIAFPPGRKIPRFKKVSMKIGQPLCFQDFENTKESWKKVAEDAELAVRGLMTRRN